LKISFFISCTIFHLILVKLILFSLFILQWKINVLTMVIVYGKLIAHILLEQGVVRGCANVINNQAPHIMSGRPKRIKKHTARIFYEVLFSYL
jgi:hypothetical protein